MVAAWSRRVLYTSQTATHSTRRLVLDSFIKYCPRGPVPTTPRRNRSLAPSTRRAEAAVVTAVDDFRKLLRLGDSLDMFLPP
jgi:hypothetical protein